MAESNSHRTLIAKMFCVIVSVVRQLLGMESARSD
jgi:hypothetical protein